MKKKLILTTIQKLRFADIEPFFLSLKKTGSDAVLHTLCSGISRKTLESVYAAGSDIQIFTYLDIRKRQPALMFWPILKPIFSKATFEWQCWLAKRVFHIMGARFVYYHEYLKKHRGAFSHVLISDCRDVYFQRDPFEEIQGHGIHVFLESNTQLIGTCRHNTHMIVNTFGKEVLQRMSNSPVSCAGTIIADEESMIAYLELLISMMCRSVNMVSGSDQGTHNYLIFTRSLPNLYIHDNYTGSVFTMGCEPPDKILLNDNGEIVRADGAVYPILHQYDRHRDIAADLISKITHPSP